MALFNEIEHKLIAVGDKLAVSKFSRVEVFALKNGDLVIVLDVMGVHEFLRKDILTWV